MHARSTRPPGRTRLAALTAAAVLGLAAALAGASPAMAATRPTLSGPATTVGYGPVTLTGTAEPGAQVTLIEAAYTYRGDMRPAVPYANGDTIVTRADSAGDFTLTRTMDSGFVFAAEADGLRSEVITIEMISKPSLQLETSGTEVAVTVIADPNESSLPVSVQHRNGTAWVVAAQGYVPQQPETPGAAAIPYTTSITGLTAGERMYFRVGLGPSVANAVLLGYSDVVEIVVGGDSGGPITQPPPSTPPSTPPAPPTPPSPPLPPPTTPTPGPSKPTTPAPIPLKRGEIQVSMVQYNAPGADRATNAGYNQEYVGLTNYTTRTINLKGLTVKDRAGNTYRFTTDAKVYAKKSLYVLTGKGTDGKPSNYRYWGRSGYIWNNGGDAAYLWNGSKLIDSCTWGNGSGRTYC